MTSMTQDFKGFQFFWTFPHYWLLLKFLSHYPKIDSSYWLKEDVQWITGKIFGEKFLFSNGFDLFFAHFSTDFSVFA